MRTFVKRSLLAGIGLLSMTHEKAHRIVEELVQRGEVRREEMARLVEDLVQRGEEERESLRKLVREELARAVDELGLATRKDLQELKAEIRKQKGE